MGDRLRGAREQQRQSCSRSPTSCAPPSPRSAAMPRPSPRGHRRRSWRRARSSAPRPTARAPRPGLARPWPSQRPALQLGSQPGSTSPTSRASGRTAPARGRSAASRSRSPNPRRDPSRGGRPRPVRPGALQPRRERLSLGRLRIRVEAPRGEDGRVVLGWTTTVLGSPRPISIGSSPRTSPRTARGRRAGTGLGLAIVAELAAAMGGGPGRVAAPQTEGSASWCGCRPGRRRAPRSRRRSGHGQQRHHEEHVAADDPQPDRRPAPSGEGQQEG